MAAIRMMETGSLAPGGHGKTLNTSIVCGVERLMPKDYISET